MKESLKLILIFLALFLALGFYAQNRKLRAEIKVYQDYATQQPLNCVSGESVPDGNGGYITSYECED